MIQHIDISGVRFEPDDAIQKYAHDKVSKLGTFISPAMRAAVHAEVVLREDAEPQAPYACQMRLRFHGHDINASSDASSMIAAIDLTEAKVATQLKKLHDTTVGH